MNIKMIALDLDGTTLNGWRLTERTQKTLEKAIEKGVHVVIATGRTYSSLPEDIFKIKGLEYIITSNGAHITNLPADEIIYSNCTEGHVIEELSYLLEESSKFPIEVFTEGRAYIDKEVFDYISLNGSTYMNVGYIQRTRKPVPEIYNFLRRHKDNIENINIHFELLEEKAEFKKSLDKINGITVTSSFPHNIEIGGPTTSKASAIEHLCSALDIDKSEVMACGDSHNDCAMIEFAGLGVAMGNAEEDVKAIADYVTLSDAEDGVAHAVEKFVLDK